MNMTALARPMIPKRRSPVSNFRVHGFSLCLISLALSAVLSVHLASAADDVATVTKSLPKTFKGATVNFPLPSGPAPEAYIKVSKEFEEATGIEVNFTILSYQELHQKLILDLTSGSNSFDALMFAYQWKREIDPYMADLKALSGMWPGGLGGLSDPAQSQVAGRFKWSSPPGGSLLGGWACGVNKSSANRDAAYVYCAWLTSPEIVRKAALYGGAPCRVSSFQDPELVKKYPYYPAILDGMNNSIEYPPVKEAEGIHILVYDQVNA